MSRGTFPIECCRESGSFKNHSVESVVWMWILFGMNQKDEPSDLALNNLWSMTLDELIFMYWYPQNLLYMCVSTELHSLEPLNF